MPAFAGEDLNVRCLGNTRRHSPIGNPPIFQRHPCSGNVVLGQAEGQIASIARHEAAKLGHCDRLATALNHTCDRADVDQIGNLLKVHPASVKALYRREVHIKGHRLCAFCAICGNAGYINRHAAYLA